MSAFKPTGRPPGTPNDPNAWSLSPEPWLATRPTSKQ
jgi:hypothetical protein